MHNLIISFIEARLETSAGKLIKLLPIVQCHSLLTAFVQCLGVHLSQSSRTVTDTGNASRTISISSGNFKVAAVADETTYGIVIGTGEDPVTMADYKLGSQVTTNITYGNVAVSDESPDSSSSRSKISRPFLNNTGSPLNVTEVGLVGNFTSGNYKVLLDRTLYNVTIPYGVSVTITYYLTVSL